MAPLTAPEVDSEQDRHATRTERWVCETRIVTREMAEEVSDRFGRELEVECWGEVVVSAGTPRLPGVKRGFVAKPNRKRSPSGANRVLSGWTTRATAL